jgi:plasmid segregation protein ParM
LDIGRSAVKIVAGGAGVERIELDFPSAFCRSIRMADDSAAAKAAAETVSVKGVDYFVGKTAIIQGRDDMIGGLNDNWATLPQHAALLLSGIKRLEDRGLPGASNGLVVVGLPARLYASQRKEYALTISEYLPRAEIKVVPQSMGPFYTMLLDSTGREQSDFEDSSWAFIEVGQYTTDFALIDQGHVVERGLDSCDGMRLAAEQLQRLLLGAMQVKVTLAEASDLLARPLLRSYGQEIDVSALVREAVEPLAQTIADKAGQLFGADVRSLSGIRIAGGGAPLVRTALVHKWASTESGAKVPENFVSVSENARFAVAEGFYRFARGLEALRQQTPQSA